MRQELLSLRLTTSAGRCPAGYFRLVYRLVTQIERIQAFNKLNTLTPEVVDAAREALLTGH